MNERVSAELDLLQSMYPGEVTYNEQSQDLVYTNLAGKLQLRLPEDYLSSSLPEVLLATAHKIDQRDHVKTFISDTCVPGEEILDSIIAYFNDLSVTNASEREIRTDIPSQPESRATVIVWLHHLLNTNKRKQALSPESPSVSGITKPGYPGVLLYSGPSVAVYEHVNDLKNMNWQAFQLRFEGEGEWKYEHGCGVIEVEAMKDIVADIEPDKKELFLEAMRMK